MTPTRRDKRRSPRWRAFKFALIRRVLLPILAFPVRLLVRSWRYELVPPDGMKKLCTREDHPVVVACLHGSAFMTLGLIDHSRKWGRLDSTTMVSPSRDGVLLADLLGRFGQRTVSGSSSKRGSSALLELIEATRQGTVGTISVDGPRGPRCHPGGGIFRLAGATNARLRLITAAASPAFRLPSWDRHLIPLPFARVRFRFVDFHDYAKGGFEGDERRALSDAFVENLRIDGEPVDGIVPLEEKNAANHRR